MANGERIISTGIRIHETQDGIEVSGGGHVVTPEGIQNTAVTKAEVRVEADGVPTLHITIGLESELEEGGL
jgi:hypothetical protein